MKYIATAMIIALLLAIGLASNFTSVDHLKMGILKDIEIESPGFVVDDIRSSGFIPFYVSCTVKWHSKDGATIGSCYRNALYFYGFHVKSTSSGVSKSTSSN